MLLNKDKEQTILNNLVQALMPAPFPNVHRLLLIGCTLPISRAEAERSFSLMKRIKTCTRSQGSRHNSCALLGRTNSC